jgi:hypothetical protein
MAEALEAMFPGEGGRYSMWDIFDQSLIDGGQGRYTSLGDALGRLGAAALERVAEWLEEHAEEATNERGRDARQVFNVVTTAKSMAMLSAMAVEEPHQPDGRHSTLPLAATAYTRGGRALDLTRLIELDRMRRRRGYISRRAFERDVEEKLGIPRSTAQEIVGRMEEIGFSSNKFTLEDWIYIAVGRDRGRPTRQS